MSREKYIKLFTIIIIHFFLPAFAKPTSPDFLGMIRRWGQGRK
jgi:hypothetical protein